MTKYLMGTLALPPFLPPSHLDAVSPFPPFAPSLLDQASLSFLGHSATLDLSRGTRAGENGHVLDGGERESMCGRYQRARGRPPRRCRRNAAGRLTCKISDSRTITDRHRPLRYLEETRWKRVEREQTHRDPLLLLHHHTTTPSPASLILRDRTRKKP